MKLLNSKNCFLINILILITITLYIINISSFIPSLLLRNLLENVQNPMEKEFEENRKTFIEEDKKRILSKLDNVLSKMESDPSLGFPVVKPKPGQDKIIRHILLYNRLSPPNSLRTGEFSSSFVNLYKSIIILI